MDTNALMNTATTRLIDTRTAWAAHDFLVANKISWATRVAFICRSRAIAMTIMEVQLGWLNFMTVGGERSAPL